MNKSPIGLNAEKSNELAASLNKLLANYQIFYMNVRGFHWNVKGDSFFTLHPKFEEEYSDLLEKVDAIAERILTLGASPWHAFSQYLANSDIAEVTNITDGKECVKQLLAGYGQIIHQQRQVLELANAAEDEGTAALLSEYITSQEKLIWMYNAYLN